MAVINHKKKWLYLMEPHTASRATSSYLIKHMGASEIGHHHIDVPELVNVRRQHITPKQLSEYDIICTVRNPFDIIVTRWKFSGKGGMRRKRAERIAKERGEDVNEVLNGPLNQVQSLKDWVLTNVDHPNLNNPMRGLYRNATHIVYYEFLNEDLSTTFNRDIEIPYSPKHQTESKGDWREYFKDQFSLVEYLTDKWRGFLGQFGYEVVTTPDNGIDVVVHSKTRNRLVHRVKLP